MASSFPTGLDNLDATRGTSGQPLNNPDHVTHHTNEDDAIEALEATVGVTGSAVTSSLNYKLTNASSSNPGHKHTLAQGATDVTATAAELNYSSGVTSAIQTQINGKQASDATLTALAGLDATAGLVVETAADTFTKRSIAAGSTKIAVSNADGVLGNPTIDVTEANLTHDNIGGTLGITKGGTGQTTKTEAFDALAPTTTKGDIIVSNGTDNVRLAVSATNGHVLQVDSSTATGVKWAASTGSGDVLGPATNTDGKIPNWNGANSKTLADGYGVVTTLGSPGANTNIPTEQAVRAAISSAGGGDVSGPASSTDNAIVRFDGLTGKLIQNSAATVADTSGDIAAGKYNKITVTAPATGATLTLAEGSTLATSGAYSTTLTATGATNVTLPTTGTLATTSNKISDFAACTSAELAGKISDETGTGKVVFDTSPTLVTPTLGVASATSVNKVAVTAPATSATLTLADGSTLATSGAYSTTLTATGATNVTLPTTGTLSTLAGTEELTNKTLNASVGKGTWTASGTWTLPAWTMGGNVIMSENVSIDLDDALSADGKYCGISENGTAGTTLAFGDLCYFQAADSRWELVDANLSAGYDKKLGMCILAAAADGSATKMLLYGKIRADAKFPTMTIGSAVYMSETAGAIVVAQPTTTDAAIRVVGYGNTADELFFNPSSDYITHT